MKKVNALMKYEFINLRRGVLLWIIPVLYIFGIQQDINSMCSGKDSFLSLVELINAYWLPLNMTFIPILLIGIRLGGNEDDIFETMDVSPWQLILSKVNVLLIIDGLLLAANIILAAIVGKMCNVTIGYFMYESKGIIINTIVSLLFCSFLALFLGKVVSRKFSPVVAYILAIIAFVTFTNFYKTSNDIFPLFDIRTNSNSFDLISYDKSYLYHNLFWLIMTFVLFMFTFSNNRGKEKDSKVKLIRNGSLILAGVVGLFLAINVFMMTPTFYDIDTMGKKISEGSSKNKDTFYISENCGYYVDKYNMNVDISDVFKNDCSMEIKLEKDNINSIEIGLYNNLKVSKVQVDGNKINFKRTSNSLIVKLPRNYKNGEVVNMKVSYKGKVNTTWLNGEEFFFARSNGIFLADVFEWYPKLNDGKLKEYSLDIKYKGKNKIYSNLDDAYAAGEYKLSGQDKEIFLISGNMTERRYKDWLLIGNEEEINNNKQCDFAINEAKINNSIKQKKVIFAPFIPDGEENEYENAFLHQLSGFRN